MVMSNTKDTKENNILGAYFWKCYNVSPFEHSLSRFKERKMKIMTYRKKLGKSVGTWRASHDTEFL